MENLVALGIGIIASLISTALFIGLSELTRRVIIPKFRDMVYKGVRLDGRWELDSQITKLKKAATVSLNLNQKGTSVWGTYSHKDEETKEMSCYNFKGDIRDLYLVSSIHPQSRHQVDCAVFMFSISSEKGSLMLKGGMIMRAEPFMQYQGDLVFRHCT